LFTIQSAPHKSRNLLSSFAKSFDANFETFALIEDSYDYVIVGAGSAGCVLAVRLSKDVGTPVLLLEAGGGTSNSLDLQDHPPRRFTRLIPEPQVVGYAVGVASLQKRAGLQERFTLTDLICPYKV
jgi:hypothetical protein